MRFTEPAMRPPQEARSLILPATQGCTYNKCNFCYVSRGYPFLAIKSDELEKEILCRKKYFSDDTKIYMTGSNPFALPARKLKEYLNEIRLHIPNFSRVSLQSRIDDISRKTDAELYELRHLGLQHLYIGVENGNEKVLKIMNKGHTVQDTIEQLGRLRVAGITYTNFYVLGLGGKGLGVESGKLTAQMFNKTQPKVITTTGMTIFENTPIAQMVKEGNFVEATEREKIIELYAFLNELNTDSFYDGVHYLNPLNYRFRISNENDKKQILADIEDILNTYSDEELEQMVNRKQMLSL